MGNVEKWVVLGVLALIVGILVISLNVDDPLKKENAVFAGATETPARAAQPPASPLLSSNVNTSAPEPVVQEQVAKAPPITPIVTGAPIPAGSILKTTEGLQESYMTDAMFYTWKSGDSFPALAQRFYADPSRLATLKRVNEGRTEVQPGERVLVPIFDLDAAEPRAHAASAVPAVAQKSEPVAKTAAAAPVAPPVASEASSSVLSGGSRIHVVKEGESLWKIAKQELGSGSRWNEIYTANRDVLSSPEALHTGQKLRVP